MIFGILIHQTSMECEFFPDQHFALKRCRDPFPSNPERWLAQRAESFWGPGKVPESILKMSKEA